MLIGKDMHLAFLKRYKNSMQEIATGDTNKGRAIIMLIYLYIAKK